jgi:hypothetical protein
MSTQKHTALDAAIIDEDALGQFCASLQPLPSVLRYYDEFDDTTRSIRAPTEENVFELFFHGRCLKAPRYTQVGRAPDLRRARIVFTAT